MSEDQFMKMFQYMQREFAKVNERFDQVDGRIDTLTNAVDHLIADYDVLVDEEAAGAEQSSRFSDKDIAKLKKFAKMGA